MHIISTSCESSLLSTLHAIGFARICAIVIQRWVTDAEFRKNVCEVIDSMVCATIDEEVMKENQMRLKKDPTPPKPRVGIRDPPTEEAHIKEDATRVNLHVNHH